MNKRYTLGIIISILVLVFNQAFIQYWLEQKKSDAYMINVAGKQRMLSQRINLEFYQKNVSAIETDLIEWESVHRAFLNGDEKLNIEVITNSNATNLLSAITIDINNVKKQLEVLKSGGEVDFKLLDEGQAHFLKLMNSAVNVLEEESEERLFFIKITELVLMLFSIIILTLEVLYIYRPINKELNEQNELLEKKATEVERSNKELEKLNNSLQEYAFLTAHDLSEPVRKITTYSFELEKDLSGKLKSDESFALNTIKNSSIQLKNYFMGILQLNDIDEKKRWESFNLKEGIESIFLKSKSEFNQDDSTIEFKIDEPIIVKFDKEEFFLLFFEMIKNSFVYAKKEESLNILVSGKIEGDFIEIAFQDNGIGLDANYDSKVFQMFQRLHTRNEYPGYGIGLALCKKIIETMGGDISIDSGYMEGARFIIRLPSQLLSK